MGVLGTSARTHRWSPPEVHSDAVSARTLQHSIIVAEQISAQLAAFTRMPHLPTNLYRQVLAEDTWYSVALMSYQLRRQDQRAAVRPAGRSRDNAFMAAQVVEV
jgi:hypothetical protein